MLGIKIHRESFGDFTFCVLEHHDGKGGLVAKPGEVSSAGWSVHFNVDGRTAHQQVIQHAACRLLLENTRF